MQRLSSRCPCYSSCHLQDCHGQSVSSHPFVILLGQASRCMLAHSSAHNHTACVCAARLHVQQDVSRPDPERPRATRGPRSLSDVVSSEPTLAGLSFYTQAHRNGNGAMIWLSRLDRARSCPRDEDMELTHHVTLPCQLPEREQGTKRRRIKDTLYTHCLPARSHSMDLVPLVRFGDLFTKGRRAQLPFSGLTLTYVPLARRTGAS